MGLWKITPINGIPCSRHLNVGWDTDTAIDEIRIDNRNSYLTIAIDLGSN